jgi:glycosyltransferase involved in cell wall biosynthesis
MVTVLLATHNGADTLPQTLDSLCRLDTAGLPWRVVAVDNASTDATPRILRGYEQRLPLTILHEKRRGKNHALNRALDAASGDVLLCIDDDVVLDPGWLRAIKAVFDAHPEMDIVCGPVEPLWPAPVPDWLLEAIPPYPSYCITPADVPEGPCSPRLVLGANMALRMSVFRAGHRWNPAVGTDGTRFYALGSDTELTLRLHAAGHKIWFCREARVKHIILPSQLTRFWLWTRALSFARGDIQKARRANPEAGDVPRLFGVPRYALPLILRHAIGAFTATLRGDVRAQYRALWECGYACGAAYEGWRESRGAAP